MPLSLNDPVNVELSDQHHPLTGIVAHLGPVEFADGDDWIGVRLTGVSAGKGKNGGKVKGKQYFDAGGDKGGVFVRAKNVSPRTLTRLEELKLKRELAKSS
eukprot:CAMPEP_0172484902 /NCGR_PEP_ID=MMETSP1066-20121228/12580_1 /TAXON_ID=671091 /ORGANISM="Coscinodiscus wailesii, Strain CCMP2513" /LENGTH=100 /DNA_ID=CAMNT_0013249729 /DNA_START=188 /DNA_END=487 /DNA_ORIENTATION=+